jgi:group I intron endonuclease
MKNNQNNTIVTKNNDNTMSVDPVISYANADTQKQEILNANSGKTGIYRWTHSISGKSYVGSAIDLSLRLKNYYNLSYLESETNKNNSMIYRALIKYGYSSFKLDILEYCDPSVLIEREQYYLDNLEPSYNILKIAGSLSGFKHSEATIELMRASKLGRNRTEAAKLKIAAGSAQAQPVIVTNNKTG